MADGPRGTYRRRREARLARAAALARRERWIAHLRLALFFAGAVLAWAVLARGVAAAWLALPAAGFLAAVAAHGRTAADRLRAERGARYYEAGLDRLDDRWAGRGRQGAGYLDPAHPYASDLDLFGRGSLFELLSRARTRAGERILAGWLTSPAPPAEIAARHEAVRELRDDDDLREDLAALGGQPRSAEGAAVAAWSAAGPPATTAWPAAVALTLALANVAAVAFWVSRLWRPGGDGGLDLSGWLRLAVVPAVAFLASALFVRLTRRRTRAALEAADRSRRDLLLLSALLERLERQTFHGATLRRLGGVLRASGRPSRHIGRLAWLVEVDDWRSNLVFTPLALLVLLGPQLAFALERWRRDHGARVAGWLDAAGEIEALASIATHARERRADPFPEIVEDGAARLEAEALAHPLLPAGRAVANDVRLEDAGGDPRLLLVSGSNMSGKSTLLRAIGVNVVLALAGAPVRAHSMRLAPLALGTSIRVQDSLQDGTSRFYAEVLRLRQIFDLAEQSPPALFLLDEILGGTNSDDRRTGARGVIRGLLARGAIGLVTTHDLELTRIADELGGAAINVHFADAFRDGRIVFDYRLRPGPVGRGNALALMRSAGLDV